MQERYRVDQGSTDCRPPSVRIGGLPCRPIPGCHPIIHRAKLSASTRCETGIFCGFLSSRNFCNFVHNLVAFCFQLGHGMFKTFRYSNSRKVAEAVSRFLSQAKILFSTSLLFYSLSRKPRCQKQRGFPCLASATFHMAGPDHRRFRVYGLPGNGLFFFLFLHFLPSRC